MRVLVLHAELGSLRGGGENFTKNLFASVVAMGHNVTAAFTADPFGHYPFAMPAGIQPMPIRGYWSRSFGHATLSAVGQALGSRPSMQRKWDYIQNGLAWRTCRWYNRTFERRIVRQIEHAVRDVDVIYVHSNPFLAGVVAGIRPTVLRLPGPLTSEVMPTLRSIHAVCANGDALQQIQSFLGDQAIELPVGLNHSLFAPGAASNRSRIGFSAEHKILGYVGRLSRIKGVDILADAFRELSRTHPHVRLLLVGTGEEEQNLRAILKSESSRGLVHFAGDVPHEDLPAWYRAMDILIMPSRYENYSNAVLEALACGIPFIGSDVGGNRALFQTGAAWLFEASSPTSLAATMDLALADLQVLRARGAIGRKHVEGRYDWSATARRFEEIVRGLRVRPS